MSSRKYYRKFKAANKHAFGGKYRKRDIVGKRAIHPW